ncbi:MAG: thioesterase family protein [Pseudomonadales bacterium]|nr:thioesterase family protein [Pseudomonadales bacterium]
MHPFDQNIELTRVDETNFEIDISPDWQINVGPNGGYIAAILLNACYQPGIKQTIRSFTSHFLSASKPGPATVVVFLAKPGRTVSSATAQLKQGDKIIAIALASFADTHTSLTHSERSMPEVTKPAAIPQSQHMNPAMTHYAEFRAQYDQRLAIGPIPPSIGETACVGGWSRMATTRPLDDLAILAISDSWFPSIYAVTSEPIHAPTIDHTVHFINPIPEQDKHDFVLVMFQTEAATNGYLVEDGFIWSASGVLLARSQQLAIILQQQ